jgi:polyhydroxyalkanoate synthesis regulator phasin
MPLIDPKTLQETLDYMVSKGELTTVVGQDGNLLYKLSETGKREAEIVILKKQIKNLEATISILNRTLETQTNVVQKLRQK